MTFPVAFSGRAWRNSTYLGALKPAILGLGPVDELLFCYVFRFPALPCWRTRKRLADVAEALVPIAPDATASCDD
jgi:hypothetical protein